MKKEREHPWVVVVQEMLSPMAHPPSAAAMSAYMKDQFPFLGIKKPHRLKALHGLLSKEGRPDPEDTALICQQLWALPEREYAMVGIELLRVQRRFLSLEDWPWLLSLVHQRTWWDTVDYLATDPMGRTLLIEPHQLEKWGDPLVYSSNPWDNRVAMLLQLHWKDKTNEAFLEKALAHHAKSPWFFHKKAIGWALRQYGRTNPEWVRAFVDKYKNTLSGLSIREATRKL